MNNLLQAAKCALADLEGIMPEFEPDNKNHPAWTTIKELRAAITEENYLLTACRSAATDITMYLTGEWEGNEEGWMLTLQELCTAIKKGGG